MPKQIYKKWQANSESIPRRTLLRWRRQNGGNQHFQTHQEEMTLDSKVVSRDEVSKTSKEVENDDVIPSSSMELCKQRTREYKGWLYDYSTNIPETTYRRWGTNYHANKDFSDQSTSKCSISTDIDDNVSPNISSDWSENNNVLSIASCSEDNFTSVSSSEDESQNNSIENIALQQKKMLYTESEITLDEAVLSILEMWIKQKLTKTTLNIQLKLLHTMLPKDNVLPKTVYNFFKYVESQSTPCPIIKHFFCRKCLIYISEKYTESENCKECGEKDISYFFELDFIEQIKRILETPNLSGKLKNVQMSRSVSDIVDGIEYQRVNIGRQKEDLTLLLYTDGISLSKSSKTHCWPLMFTIAELPFEIRNSYIITAGLWFDMTIKPPMNLFLQPFCLKLKKCFDGIQWTDPLTGNTVKSVIRAPLFIADAPARAQILNMLNFNGTFGCNICEIKTKQCEQLTGKRLVRIYPYKKNSQLRNGCLMVNQAQQVDESLNLDHVKGVKGYSIVSVLPLLDIGTCVVPEYMHSVLLGVVKQFLKIWLCKRGPWKLKKHVRKMDEFLMNIKPLQSFCRMPRSLLEFRSFKASELYNWLMFYSIPTLEKFLPEIYLQHWILLVISLFNLLKQKVYPADIVQANQLLHCFVKKVKVIYGEREMSYNIHQLLHLSLCVERWGPLWATSAFVFESHNGFLAKIVHGSKDLGQEMMNNLKIAEGANIIKNRVESCTKKINKDEFVFKPLGKPVLYEQNNDIFLSTGLDAKTVKFFSRVKINDDIYTSVFYKTTKTNNYTVKVKLKDNSFLYGIIDIFFIATNELHFIVKCFDIDQSNILKHIETEAVVTHIKPIISTNTLKLVNLKELKYVHHKIRVGNYICKKPNSLKAVM